MDLIIPESRLYSNDSVLHSINKHFITLNDQSTKNVNMILHSMLQYGLIPVMREDPLFKDVYRNIIYAGSFYKGTKVGKPDEYDLDLVIKLPLNYKALEIQPDVDAYGYVKIKVPGARNLPKWQTHATILNKWLDEEGYLDQEKFRRWMEGVLTKSFMKFKRDGRHFLVDVPFQGTCRISNFRKTGPAFTIDVYIPGHFGISMDIVPCLVFDGIELEGYRSISEFLGARIPQRITVVAKPLPRHLFHSNPSRYWRLSFYEQEKIILTEVGAMKPVIRYLKKLRDTENWKNLASYYIETVVLHELFEHRHDRNFLRQSQVKLFIHMLEKLQSYLFDEKIPYFWNENYNLLNNMSGREIQNYSSRINRILVDIRLNIEKDDFVIARKILNKEEFERLIEYTTTPLQNDIPEKSENQSGYYCIIS